MDGDNDYPFGITSFCVEALNTHNVDSNKKRKLNAEQLGLPLPKHKTWQGSYRSELIALVDESPEVENFRTHIKKVNLDTAFLDDDSDPESARDSNSVAGDSDSAMSVYGEANKLEPVCLMVSNSSKDAPCSSYGMSLPLKSAGNNELTLVGEEHNPQNDGELQLSQNIEEHLLEFGSHVDYIYPKYGNDITDQYTDQEYDNEFYSNEVSANNFVLSSGRWCVKKEAEHSARKPTIDQEFEEYFSMLML